MTRTYYISYIGAWQPTAVCWYEDETGAHDILCEDIPKDAKKIVV